VSRSLDERPSLLHLFLSFLRLGLTAFGGPAMVAYIREMTVQRKRWLDDGSFHDGVALCQTIPGATAMQTAAYVGLKARGLPGAALSFLGFGLPAFSFMMALSALYAPAHQLPVVVSAFAGLQAVIVAIVGYATVAFGRTSLKDYRSVAIAIAAAGTVGLGVSPFLVILLAALSGFLILKKRPAAAGTGGPGWRPYKPRTLVGLILILAAGFVLLLFLDRALFGLAALMLRVDLFAFGGGFASVPLMFHEVVKVRAWLDGPTFMNGIVLGQITPGPIVITGTFIGYLLAGPVGGIVATISVFLPSFLILVGVAPFYDRLRASAHFDLAIRGVLGSFVGLLLSVTVRFALNVPWDPARVVLAVAAFVALRLKVNILWVVLMGTAISVVLL
jgi:chromate transporter